MPAKFNSFFNSVEGNEGERCRYPVRLDTYGCGCQHNCGYCYARSLLAFRGLWNAQLPATADIRKIRQLVRTKLAPGDVVRLGGMTDCFQPIERGRKLTLRTIQALNERRVHYLIVTKSDLVATEPYLDAMDPALAHIQVSITTTNPETSLKLEPGAPTPDRRIAAVETLAARGFDTAVRLSPFIPELVNTAVIDAIACDKVQVEFLRVNTWIEKWLGGGGSARRPSPVHPLQRRLQAPAAPPQAGAALAHRRLRPGVRLRGRPGALGILAGARERQPRRLLQPQNQVIWKS